MITACRTLQRMALAAGICLLTQGCVGIFVPRAKTKAIDNPGVGAFARVTEVCKTYRTNQTCSATWLKNQWGNPASIRALPKEGQTELWTYRLRPIWCGVVPAFIVPLPLILPVAREQVTFFVREGEVTRAEVVESHISWFGLSASPEGGFNSVAGW
jgi:hypothetical protein